MRLKAPNLKIVGVFAVPMLFVWVGLQQLRPFVNVFDEADQLDSRLALARAAGYSFNPTDFRRSEIDPLQDAYRLMEAASRDPEFKPEKWKTINDFLHLDSPIIEVTSRRQIEFAHKVADSTQYDPHTNLSNDEEEFNCAWMLRQAVRALTYEALHSARHHNSSHSLDALQAALKVVAHFKQENDSYNTFQAISAQRQLYATVVDVACEFRGDRKVSEQLSRVLDFEPILADFKAELRLELFRLNNRISSFRGYEQFVASQTSVMTTDGCYTGTELDPHEDPLHRPVAQHPLFTRGLQSKGIAIYLEFAKIFEGESSVLSAGRRMDAYVASLPQGLYDDYLTFLVPYDRESYYSKVQAPVVYRNLAKWGLEIESRYAGDYPESLPSKPDLVFGGALRYRKIGKRFLVYSIGADGKDDWAPSTRGTGLGSKDIGDAHPVSPETTVIASVTKR